MYFWYILQKYIKSFLLVSFGLSFFYILIDLVAKFSKLPPSSNLKVLYIYYTFVHSFFLFLSLSMVFSLLYTLYYMIKRNELVSFYSLGFSKTQLFKPFLFFLVVLFGIYISFNFTPLAYSQERAESILQNKHYNTKGLFLKWNNKVIYFERINPFLKRAYNIKIFYLKDNKVYKVISAKEAVFIKNEWFSKKAKVEEITPVAIKTSFLPLFFLKDFKPKILTNLNAKKVANISLYDAFLALYLLKGVSKDILLSVIFYKIFLPLSMIFLAVILFFTSPIHIRVSNVSLFMIKSILFTIFIWGIYLLVYKFARQGVLSPFVLILPFVFISSYTLYLYYKEK